MSLTLLTPNQKMLTPEEESALIDEWITTRDQKVLLQIIKAFTPLVSKFVRKFAAYGIPKEELLSVGNLALVETADKFKPEKGFKFSTYASHWIRGMMLIFIASNYFAFSLKSQKMKHVFFKLRRIMHENAAEGVNVHEMMDKLSDHFGISPTKLEQIYDLIQHPNSSTHQPAYTRSEDDTEFGDIIPSEDPNPEERLVDDRMDAYRKQVLYSAMDEVLNQRERTIISGQMLTDPNDVQTLQNLADTFALSRERVRQIRNNALLKLERAIRAKCKDIEPQGLF